MRTPGTAIELERRRLLAVDRVRSGYTHQDVADFLGIRRETVSKWMAIYRRCGRPGLKAKPPTGRPSRLSAEREREILTWFSRSPTEFGFDTELWSAPRVAKLIRRKFGVRYHPRYVNAWLARRRITPQKPERRPRERDDRAVKRWLQEEWPRIKKARRGEERI